MLVPIRWTVRSPQTEDGKTFHFEKDKLFLFGNNFTTPIFTSSIGYESVRIPTKSYHWPPNSNISTQQFSDNKAGMRFASRSKKLQTTFDFADYYVLDGQPFDKSIDFASTQVYSLPFGPSASLNSILLHGDLPAVSAEDQSFALFTCMQFKGFEHSLSYDPDITLGLLFDTVDSPNSDPSSLTPDGTDFFHAQETG